MKEVRHISVSIKRSPSDVYTFACNPENLPKWAAGLSDSITNVNGDWIASSPMGTVQVRFAEHNSFGVLDHDVIVESGARFYNPMRVVPNDDGSELTFTLFRQPGVSNEKFAEDAAWIERDLKKLKSILET